MNIKIGVVEELDVSNANKYLEEFHKNKKGYFIDRLLGRMDESGYQQLGFARKNMCPILLLKGVSKLSHEVCIVMKRYDKGGTNSKYMIIDFCRSGTITDGMRIFESNELLEIKKYFKERLFIFEGVCDETDKRLQPRTDFALLLDTVDKLKIEGNAEVLATVSDNTALKKDNIDREVLVPVLPKPTYIESAGTVEQPKIKINVNNL